MLLKIMQVSGIKRDFCQRESRIHHRSAFRGQLETTLMQLVFIRKQPTSQLTSQTVVARFSSWSQFSLSSSLSFLSLSLSLFLFISFLFRAGRQTSTQDKDAGDRVCVTWGAVPSSVVALSAGCQGGWRPRRKRGPRGTRRRTPRWFHAIKTVRFLQQLRIAAPPTTDIHIRAIRHPCGGDRWRTKGWISVIRGWDRRLRLPGKGFATRRRGRISISG